MAKLKSNLLETDETPVLSTVIDILFKHFNYSINDIKGWEELTPEEKEIIPKEIWDEIVDNGEVL